jgi:FkbM family methyltransferase
MIRTASCAGPFGPVLVPAETEEAERYGLNCCRQLFAGEYDYGGDPASFAVRGVERPDRERDHETLHTLLDVGSNVGAFVIWGRAWWPSLRIAFCFEPNLALHPLFFENTRSLGMSIVLNRHAVTIASEACLADSPVGDWAGNYTFGARQGVPVPTFHPEHLPPADILKVDAEGVELEVFEHYKHWQRVNVCLFEYHRMHHRRQLEAICGDAGLVRARHHGAHLHEKKGEPPEFGIEVWIRL